MTKSGIKNNIPLVVRKIDKDLLEIQKTIGSASADLVNFAFQDIQKKGFLEGKGSTDLIGRNKIYKKIAGGNRASRKRPEENAFHRSKIVDRGGEIPQAFNQVDFKVNSRFSSTIATGSNGVARVIVKRSGNKENPKGQIVSVRWDGRLGQILNWFHFGQGGGQDKVQIKNSKGKIQNAKKAQRAIAFNGLKKALKRWNQYVEFKLTGTIKKRNRKKI